MLRKIGYILLIVAFILIGSGGYMSYTIYQQEEAYFSKTERQYYQLFNKENYTIESLTLSQITTLEKQIKNIKRHEKEKEKLSTDLQELKDYYLLKQDINEIYPNKILNSNIDSNTVNEIDQRFNKLTNKYKKYIESDLTEIKNQKSYIDSIELEISELFVDIEKTQLKDNITREQVESSRQKLSLLKQSDLVETNAINIINKREEEAKRKREEEIRNAWVILDVPYISQNQNNVLNGCEAASLLMGLQYKGYLKDISLQQYAADMPKSESNNAYEGFTHDIFGLEPRDVPHWIAPSALASFGRISSNNQNVIDGTGSSLDSLDEEISNHNPVVIYATGNFKTPKEWIEGAPKNIHVLLLTGYNKITKEQIVTDPWTKSNGETKWYLSKNKLESIYNAVGKKSVIIR